MYGIVAQPGRVRMPTATKMQILVIELVKLLTWKTSCKVRCFDKVSIWGGRGGMVVQSSETQQRELFGLVVPDLPLAQKDSSSRILGHACGSGGNLSQRIVFPTALQFGGVVL